MTQFDLEAIGQDVAKALSRSRVWNAAIFVSTPITYPNGTGVAVKIDQGKDGFVITDDGTPRSLRRIWEPSPPCTESQAGWQKEPALNTSEARSPLMASNEICFMWQSHQ
jgi:hypothetical protein